MVMDDGCHGRRRRRRARDEDGENGGKKNLAAKMADGGKCIRTIQNYANRTSQ